MSDSDGEGGAPGASPAGGPARFPVRRVEGKDLFSVDSLRLDSGLTVRWLIDFLRDEVRRHRGFERVVLGLSGGVDSALAAYLCAEAFGPSNVVAICMPYRTSAPESVSHAALVAQWLGLSLETIEITAAADGYLATQSDVDPGRRGNVLARQRMIVLFDQSARLRALPIGTGNKTERLFGYYTWHADDAPPVNPLGDLFKTQIWQLARHLGMPEAVTEKPASADLVVGQTDEVDLGIGYAVADPLLSRLLQGYPREWCLRHGASPRDLDLVVAKLAATHWKRHLPTVAMLSATAINEYYLRPVDY